MKIKKIINLILICNFVATAFVFADNKSLDLKDLGFSKEESSANKTLQVDLDKRSSMLKTHQTMGLITGGLMLGTLLVAESAKNKNSFIHPIAGSLTAASYATTAYFSLTAPKPESIKDAGMVKFHKALAFIHMPAMILMPIAGYMARYQIDHGQSVHGIAKFKGTLGVVAMAAFYPALISMAFDF